VTEFDPATQRLAQKLADESGTDLPPNLLLPGGLASAHGGGFNVGMADGSVQFMSGVMPALCGRNDGEMAVDF